jgi:hypothetical protein
LDYGRRGERKGNERRTEVTRKSLGVHVRGEGPEDILLSSLVGPQIDADVVRWLRSMFGVRRVRTSTAGALRDSEQI